MKINAPFTPERVSGLKAWQTSGTHPFTCMSPDIPECERTAGKSKGILEVTAEGFICPCGKYKQTWAHDFMVGPQPMSLGNRLRFIKRYDALRANEEASDLKIRLRPLTAISDEEAIKIARRILPLYNPTVRLNDEKTLIIVESGWDLVHIGIGELYLNAAFEGGVIEILDPVRWSVYQLMTHMGFALPYTCMQGDQVLTYSVEDLVEMGLVELETK